MKCLKPLRKNRTSNRPIKENIQKNFKETFKMKKQRGKLSGVKKKNIDSIKIVKISKIINFKKNSIKVLMKKARIFRSHKQNQ